jgi:hypothetical protein
MGFHATAADGYYLGEKESTMKKMLVSMWLCVAVGLGAAQAQLKIDFTVTGGAVQPGYQGYFGTDKAAATFTAQSYTAFGATVTVQASWVANAAAGALRMIDRGTDDGMDPQDLLRDWIGTDTRTTPADPMTLTLTGLPAGTYQWVSYHHDPQDQTGVFDVTVNDALGSKTTSNIDISNGVNFKLADITKFTTTIVSDGKKNITLVFHQTSASSVVANAIFVMNGFELTAVSTGTSMSPVPGNKATDVTRDGTILSWRPDAKAVAQDVYLATTFDAIDDGTTASASYQGRQDANSFDPGRLELGGTYYWRVDEVLADNTVVKGFVWNFTAEALSVPLTKANITATASSSRTADEGPEKTIDGSGLNAQDQHAVETQTMWFSSPATGAAPTWIQYQFDGVYKLHQMLVWNHNSNVESVVGFGAKAVTIEYSLDGTAWTTLGTTQEFARAPGAATYTANTTVDFAGVTAQYVRITIASNWGGIVKQSGLSEVRFLTIPTTARQPQPAVGATDVDVRSVLSWRAGREAGKHQVYLSTDVNEVRNGKALAGTVPAASFDAGGALQMGKTYYWRVDEVNDLASPSTWEGQVWSFSTVAALPVDDMESYNDAEGTDSRIYEVWADGFGTTTNGSQVGHAAAPFAEVTIFHGGKQSMPLYFSNATAGYSEATRTFAAAQDWTQFGVKGLTLWFFGDPGNTAGQLYVKVNGVKVAYDGDADNVLRKPWQTWYVELSRFTGVNLKKVTSLTIGLDGGKGVIYIDDIGLSPKDRQLVTPAAPAATNLVAQYAFEGNVKDATNAHPGVVAGAPQYTAGKVGQAIKFDGVRDYVTSEGTYNLAAYTVALWFRVDGGTGQRDVFSLYDELGGHGILLEIGDPATVRFLHRSPVSATGTGTSVYSTSTCGDGAWYHMAAVKSATTMSLYLNGMLVGSAVDATVFDKALTRMAVGVLKVDNLTRYLPGAVDELYLYGRALSDAEIASLAGRTKPFDKP